MQSLQETAESYFCYTDTMNDAFIYVPTVLLKLANVALLIISTAAFESADLSFSNNGGFVLEY